MQYNPDLINRNVAPGIADFSLADITDLRPAFPEAEHWLSNHFLNTLFKSNDTNPTRQYTINMLSRAQAQFALYHQAREAIQTYLEKSTLNRPAIRLYYTAIFLWESCFLNYQIFVDIYIKFTGKNVFVSRDKSDNQRAYDIATTIKHWGNHIKLNRHNDNHTIPMWMSNTGFHTYVDSLTYAELSTITIEIAKAANELQN